MSPVRILFVYLAVSAWAAFAANMPLATCSEEHPARFSFDGGKRCCFSLPGVKEKLAEQRPEERPREFYITCRATNLSDRVEAVFFSPYPVPVPLAFPRDARRVTLRLRPEIVVMRKAVCGYDATRLVDVQLRTRGTGTVEVLEFGTTDSGPAPRPLDEGLPAVDPDAFAFFPEPRILTVDEAVRPLSAYGFAYRCEGDVPPAPVRRFERELRTFYGLALTNAPDAHIVFSVGAQSDIPDYGKIVYDGFAVRIDGDEIRVCAKDPRGIVYGVDALISSVHMTTGDVGEPKVRLFSLVDWPRTEHRMFRDMGFRDIRRVIKYDPAFYVEMLERFVFAARYNILSVEPGSQYQWKKVPQIPVQRTAWTRADMDFLVDRVNENGISVVPSMNGLGHVNHWPLATPVEAEKYGEDGTNMVLCTANAETMKLHFDSFDEILEICSRNPKFRPHFFHAGMDEVRWQTDVTPPERRCRLCAGREKRDIYAEMVIRINDWCRLKGVRMIMCSDMVRAFHNGRNKFFCHEIEPLLPKDVIYDNWSCWDNMEIAETSAAGHDNWKVLTAYKDDREGDAATSGRGFLICAQNWWLSQDRRSNGPYGLMAQRLAAEQAWRRPSSRYSGDGGTHQAYTGDAHELIRRWAAFIQRNWSRKPLRRATAVFDAIDIRAQATLRLPGDYELGTKAVAGVPVSLAVREGGLSAVEATDEGVVVPVGRKAASLCFLQAATVPVENRAVFANSVRGVPKHHRLWPDGAPAALVEVRYSDGTVEGVRMGFGLNVTEWKTTDRLYDVMGRYARDCRGIWTGKLPNDGRTGEPMKAVVSMFEWPNPHPDKVVASVALRRDDALIRYALVALSIRRSF